MQERQVQVQAQAQVNDNKQQKQHNDKEPPKKSKSSAFAGSKRDRVCALKQLEVIGVLGKGLRAGSGGGPRRTRYTFARTAATVCLCVFLACGARVPLINIHPCTT